MAAKPAEDATSADNRRDWTARSGKRGMERILPECGRPPPRSARRRPQPLCPSPPVWTAHAVASSFASFGACGGLGSSAGATARPIAGVFCEVTRLYVQAPACHAQSARLVDARGSPARVGLVQVLMDGGTFGSVCGMNLAAADVVCRQLGMLCRASMPPPWYMQQMAGFDAGTLGSSPCRGYGGADLCGAAGSPVAMEGLACKGGELSIAECQWSAPGPSCLGHEQDAVIYCGRNSDASSLEGAARLLSDDGAPSLSGAGVLEIFAAGTWSTVCGVSPGAASVACKAMGFSGADTAGPGSDTGHGRSPPALGKLTCSGSEASLLECSFELGEDVFCAETEASVIRCAGEGDATGVRRALAP